MVGLTKKENMTLPTQYSANRALIGLCITAQHNPNPDIRHFQIKSNHLFRQADTKKR